MMFKSNENLVVSGFWGVIIGGLFMAFGGLGNFLCEMLFWSFLLYVVVMYFEIVPNVVKNMMKHYVLLSQCLSALAWVPLIVGMMIVVFLGSLLFVDYSSIELNEILLNSKIILLGMMVLLLCTVWVRRTNCFRFATSF